MEIAPMSLKYLIDQHMKNNKEISKPKTQIPLEIIIVYMKQIAEALNHLLTICKINHRDLKPDNILIYYIGDISVAKLTDLGISKEI